jgi:type VI secretion system protein ImpB
MAESLQHNLDRVRRPRVHITYDVQVGGAMKKIELPFAIGVLADLSGQPKKALAPIKERKAIYVDRDNFNDVLAKSGARLALRVPNTLTDPNSKLAVELSFRHIDDFGPTRVAEQIAPLKELLVMRHELSQLLMRMDGNDKLSGLLESILADQQKAQALGELLDQQSPKADSGKGAQKAAKQAPAKAAAPVREPKPAPVEAENSAKPEPAAEESADPAAAE